MRRFFFLVVMVAAVSALSLNLTVAQDDAPPPDPTSVLQVIDTIPLPAEEHDLTDPITIYFDRPLDCDTLEDAFSLTPDIEGTLDCNTEDNALTFTPDDALETGTIYTVSLSDDLRGADGAMLLEAPYELDVTTRGSLLVTSTLPTADVVDSPVTSVITVIFNRPVVPLGTIEEMEALPNPLTIEPAVEGEGEWINTAIYMFTPDGTLQGATNYTVTVDENLTAVDGATLPESFSFSFTTAAPTLLTARPASGSTDIRLTEFVTLNFDQPIDQASLEDAFYLNDQASGEPVPGEFEWSEDGTSVTYTPDANLELFTLYDYGYPADSVFDQAGGVTLDPLLVTFSTVPEPSIVSTDPPDGWFVDVYGGVTIQFASSMNPETLAERIEIIPAPDPDSIDYFYRTWSTSYSLTWPRLPQTEYTINIAPGMEDIYGNTIDEPFSFSFFTGDYGSDFSLRIPSGPVGFYDGRRETTSVFATFMNVEQIDVELYEVPLFDFIGALSNDSYFSLGRDFEPKLSNRLRRWAVPRTVDDNFIQYELLDLGNTVAQVGSGSSVGFACDGAPETRFKVSDRGQIITEPDPLRAREAPPSGEIVDLLYNGYQFEVVGGPVCASELVWWEISLRDGGSAWVAEGFVDDAGESEYFIEVTVPSQVAEIEMPEDLMDGGALPPGVYYLRVGTPSFGANNTRRQIMVVGTTNIVFKTSVDSAVAWVTDVHTGEPMADTMVSLYGNNITPQTVATNSDGVARFEFERVDDLYQPLIAVVDDGTEFGVGFSEWADGIEPWRFGLNYTFYPPEYQTYMYTDRPIYRPGQPVYYRGVIRLKDDVNYTPPDFDSVPVQIYDGRGNLIFDSEVEVTPYGTFSGELMLADDAAFGSYSIDVQLPARGEFQRESARINFDVAQFRLPEFQVEVEPLQTDVLSGDTVEIAVDASFFFGGPVVDAVVEYRVNARDFFYRYDEGRYSFYDYNPDRGDSRPVNQFDDFFFGGFVTDGTGRTDDAGRLLIELPVELAMADPSQRYSIEATVRDSSGQSVSGRSFFTVHRAEVYVGVEPNSYVGTAEESNEIEVITLDWDGEPVSGQMVDVTVVERRWSSLQEFDPITTQVTYSYELEEIPVDERTLRTGADGTAIFTYTPPNGGVFKVTATVRDSQGNTNVASDTQWVSSGQFVPWRVQNDNRIDLIADGGTYQVGDTAQILVQSPFQGETQMFVTVERGDTLTTELMTVDTNSIVYELPITEDFAPNVFVSVMLVKGVDENNPVAAFRMGSVGLEVDNSRKELQITVEPDVERVGPRDTVTYTVTTTDYSGAPVSAEVGVALTDLASLSIAPPNSGPILTTYYGNQPLSVRTSTALTINTDQLTQYTLDTIKGGGGGGGGDFGVIEVREEFIDTAYWNASVITDDDGTATFEITLPDNLTTWRLDARGLTLAPEGDLLVGEETYDIISTKPVLIRPVTPRFFVVDDRVFLAAVVNNNSGDEQEVAVTLEADGVTLMSDATQTVTIADGRTARVNWEVVVEDVAEVELIFVADAGDFTDASRPQIAAENDGLLPVYKYEAPDITGTGGILRSVGERTEAIVLPRRFDVTQGELTVNVQTSLGATTLDGVRSLNNTRYQSASSTASRLITNAVSFRALNELGYDDPELRADLTEEINIGLQRLSADQKDDGGWGWQLRDNSDVLVTSYVVVALIEASEAGFAVDPEMLLDGINFLQTNAPPVPNTVTGLQGTWRIDRTAWVQYALARAGVADRASLSNLYEQRGNLSLYAQALLALSIHQSDPEDTQRLTNLVDTLFSEVIISANGAHWEESSRDPSNWNSDTRTTAIILKALVALRPESDILPNAVRWLIVARTADAWETNQETAWAVGALTDWLLYTGEFNPDYSYDVALNGDVIAADEATRDTVLETQQVVVDVADLLAGGERNLLTFDRTSGDGALYYTTYLRTFLPVPEIDPVNRGVIIQRRYTLLGDDSNEPITEGRVGDVVQVRLTIIAPNNLNYLVIDDPLPAGAEGINPRLLTSQQVGTRPGLDDSNPLRRGWGWWWFSNIEFRNERVVLASYFLPAGTYEYVYTMRLTVPGEYNVIPPVGFEFYFPEVFGRGAGSSFTVLPAED